MSGKNENILAVVTLQSFALGKRDLVTDLPREDNICQCDRFCPRWITSGNLNPHCGLNIVFYEVAHSWKNAATLLHAARPQKMFLQSRFSETFFCVQDTKSVPATNVARVAKRVNICRETWPRQNCCRHNASSFFRPLKVMLHWSTCNANLQWYDVARKIILV